MKFQRFQTKPTAVEAVRLADDASNWEEVAEFLGIDLLSTPRPPLTVVVPTHKGQAPLRRGDWVVRGDGKTATLSDADFRKLYVDYDGELPEDDEAEPTPAKDDDADEALFVLK